MDSKVLLWLDDIRDPLDEEVDWMVFSCLGKNCEVHWVKNYDSFVGWIKQYGLPDGINFDHDLADEHYTPQEYWDDYDRSKSYQDSRYYTEKTGYDCAKWLVEYCFNRSEKLPKYYVHSATPVGADNIRRVLKNYSDL